MTEARIMINLKDGTIELEGSESFVEKHYEELKKYFEQPALKIEGESGKKQKKDSKTHSPAVKRQISYAPIPVDLKGEKDKPPLKEFFKVKDPKTNQEIITVFAYYLDKYCKITDMEFGHAVSCYNEVGARKPKNLLSLCSNVRSRGGWLETGGKSYTFKITIAGQNLVEHDLPHNDKLKK